MAQGKVLGKSSGGLKIQGIIEEYTAQGNISAGDFVSFINGLRIKSMTELNSSSNTARYISAVKLSENKVFIAYGYSTLRAMICTVSNETITIETDTQLSSSSRSGYYLSAVKLSENKVFIAHNYYSSSRNRIGGIVCTIKGTSITAGADTQLSSTEISSTISAVKVDDNKVFVAYHGYQTEDLYGVVCTIEGTTINIGTITSLTSSVFGMYNISTVLLENNKIFLTYLYNSSGSPYKLYGMICTIEGTTISVVNNTNIGNTYTSSYIVLTKITNSSIFIANPGDDGKCFICTISSDEIVIGSTILFSSDRATNAGAAILIDTNKILLIYGRNTASAESGNYYLYATLFIIEGTTITIDRDAQISKGYINYSISAVLYDNNKVFINFGSSSKLEGIAEDITDRVKKISVTKEIFGISKSNVTNTQKAQIYIPNYN